MTDVSEQLTKLLQNTSTKSLKTFEINVTQDALDKIITNIDTSNAHNIKLDTVTASCAAKYITAERYNKFTIPEECAEGIYNINEHECMSFSVGDVRLSRAILYMCNNDLESRLGFL